ncbi:unnamed protein product [Periconia digitata]|uniref:Uncharacterized protein n=1 Tax=Periconia digitata TaxID=1303443 RepID=A0A9W4UC98_9PLEO|nr:unnamed protein product [Periconia digitata]
MSLVNTLVLMNDMFDDDDDEKRNGLSLTRHKQTVHRECVIIKYIDFHSLNAQLR